MALRGLKKQNYNKIVAQLKKNILNFQKKVEPHATLLESSGDSATAWIRTRVTSATTRNTNHYTTVADIRG